MTPFEKNGKVSVVGSRGKLKKGRGQKRLITPFMNTCIVLTRLSHKTSNAV